MERIAEYFVQLLDMLRHNRWVVSEDLSFREIDSNEGYVRGTLYLNGGCVLHVAEYIEIEQGLAKRIKYRYQLQDHNDLLVRRWDNAPHHKEISTYPHHCHAAEGSVFRSLEMDIPSALSQLNEILDENNS